MSKKESYSELNEVLPNNDDISTNINKQNPSQDTARDSTKNYNSQDSVVQ